MSQYITDKTTFHDHPISKHIPWTTWVLWPFTCHAGSTDLKRTEGTLKEASLHPVKNKPRALARALFCLIHSHPNDSAQELLETARRMGCDEETILRAAASSGRLDLLKMFLSQKVTALLEASNFLVYRYAAANGHLVFLKYSESLMDDENKAAARKALNYWAYHLAAANGHLHVLLHLESKMSSEEINMMRIALGSTPYRQAARNGHVHVLKHLESQMSDIEKAAARKVCRYEAYTAAAEGHLDVLLHLESQMSEKEKIEARKGFDYSSNSPYCKAAEKGHVHILQHLDTQMSDEEKTAADKTGCYYNTYNNAARKGLLHVLQHLELQPIGKNRYGFEKYRAFCHHAKEGRKEIASQLLRDPNAFGFASGDPACLDDVNALVRETIASWREYQTTTVSSGSIVSPDKHLSYKIAAHLVQENTDEALSDLGFLLSIPDMAVLVWKSVPDLRNSPCWPLRMALDRGNQGAIDMLLSVAPPIIDLRQMSVFNSFTVNLPAFFGAMKHLPGPTSIDFRNNKPLAHVFEKFQEEILKAIEGTRLTELKLDPEFVKSSELTMKINEILSKNHVLALESVKLEPCSSQRKTSSHLDTLGFFVSSGSSTPAAHQVANSSPATAPVSSFEDRPSC